MFDLISKLMDGMGELPVENATEGLVLYHLCNAINESGTCWWSINKIARQLHVGPRSVTRALKNMQSKGLLSIRYQYDNKGFQTSSSYAVNVDMLEIASIAGAERRAAEKEERKRKDEEREMQAKERHSEEKPTPAPMVSPIVEVAQEERPPLDAIMQDGDMEDVVIDETPACEFEEEPFVDALDMIANHQRADNERGKQEALEITRNAVEGVRKFFINPDAKDEPEPSQAPINRGIRSNIITDSAFPQPVGTTPGWGERVWCGVTKQLCSPGAKRDEIYEVLSLLWPKYNSEAAMIEYLTPFYQAWTSRKGKNGVRYSPTNPVWLTEWVSAGAIPEDAKEQEPAHRSKPQVW